MAASIAEASADNRKPDLLFKLEGFGGDVNDAIFAFNKDAIITGSDDRILRVWVRRDGKRFWPSVCELLPSSVTTLFYCTEMKKIYAGLDNGTIVEFLLADDTNSLKHIKDYLAHVARVTGIVCALEMEWLVSTSKDRTVAWYHLKSGSQLGEYLLEFPGTCIQYDSGSNYLFVGDTSGRISLLCFSLNSNGARGECRMIRELQGHGESVNYLAWDVATSRLLSGSSDSVVILWDIGGGKGSAYELQVQYLN
ncbi:unnamed protein product [Protopolystoma xenopodis]|uniref:Uncharacterized protein n=1 Tax=Protopolystoma xenopodis TaxID=117903 RepID=A0A3S5CCD2_9PLAT|nr:unnamed protein product [Protopolystoma xenopodis]